jgi:hypothetical protein
MKTLQRVCSGINITITKEMEHIGQSIVKEYDSPLKILMGDRSARQRIHIILIDLKPLCIAFNKSLSLADTFNPINLGQQTAELSTGFSFGISPQPTHPFVLQMIQTALEGHIWPDQAHGPHNGAFTISSNKARIQALLFQMQEPGMSLLERLLLEIAMSNNLLVQAIHQIQQATILMKVGGIIKQILYLGISDGFRRYLGQPIILNVIKSKGTVTGKLAQPPNRIAFDNPQLKPMLTTSNLISSNLPDKGMVTLLAKKPLFK